MFGFRSIAVLAVALLALVSPTLVSAFSAVALGGGVIVRADDGSLHAEAAPPCELQGGKRVLPCTPDLGVLLRPAEVPAVLRGDRARPASDRIPAGLLPDATAPPPRAA